MRILQQPGDFTCLSDRLLEQPKQAMEAAPETEQRPSPESILGTFPMSPKSSISDIPHTYWRASQSRTNFETPKINLHVEPPENDQEFDGTGEKMTPKKLRAEIFWLSRSGLHLWLRKPPQDADNETEEIPEFKLVWNWVKRCYMAQAKKIDEKTFELDSSANYCDLPIPKFVLELEKVIYSVRVDI